MSAASWSDLAPCTLDLHNGRYTVQHHGGDSPGIACVHSVHSRTARVPCMLSAASGDEEARGIRNGGEAGQQPGAPSHHSGLEQGTEWEQRVTVTQPFTRPLQCRSSTDWQIATHITHVTHTFILHHHLPHPGRSLSTWHASAPSFCSGSHAQGDAFPRQSLVSCSSRGRGRGYGTEGVEADKAAVWDSGSCGAAGLLYGVIRAATSDACSAVR